MFLLLFILFIIGTATFGKVIFFSTQPGQWLDQLTGWQNIMNKYGTKTGFINELIYKAMGGCEFCYSHAMSFLTFWLFVTFATIGFNAWPDINSTILQVLLNIAIYLLYISTSTVITTLTITRL